MPSGNECPEIKNKKRRDEKKERKDETKSSGLEGRVLVFFLC